MARVIKVDGTEERVEVPEGKERLTFLQKLVGGYIEVVRPYEPMVPLGSLLLVNEEGLLRNLPVNEKASLIAGRTIVGDVVIVKSLEEFE